LDSLLAVNAAKLVIWQSYSPRGWFFIASLDEEKSIHQSF